MNALRWMLGVGTAAFILGWGAPVTAGDSFSMGVLYSAAWLVYYYHAVWRAAASVVPGP